MDELFVKLIERIKNYGNHIILNMKFIIDLSDIQDLNLKLAGFFSILPFGYEPESILNKHNSWIVKKISFYRRLLKQCRRKRFNRKNNRHIQRTFYAQSCKRINQ